MLTAFLTKSNEDRGYFSSSNVAARNLKFITLLYMPSPNLGARQYDIMACYQILIRNLLYDDTKTLNNLIKVHNM